jgi:hypothetical protein
MPNSASIGRRYAAHAAHLLSAGFLAA